MTTGTDPTIELNQTIVELRAAYRRLAQTSEAGYLIGFAIRRERELGEAARELAEVRPAADAP